MNRPSLLSLIKRPALRSSLFLACTLAMVIGGSGCARRPPFPDQSTEPARRATSLDGIWRLTSGNITSLFRIDKGRMFYYEKRKPASKRLPSLPVSGNNPRLRSAADLSSRPGGVIARNILETDDPLVYRCHAAWYDATKRIIGFGPGEIRIVSPVQIVLANFPNPQLGLGEKVEEAFLKEALDNQSWFSKSIENLADSGSAAYANPPTGKTPSRSHSPPAPNRKVIIVPADKMESGGRLSNSAKGFIARAVQDARDAHGAVEIRYPVNAPNSVVDALSAIGASTALDEHRDNDYEMVIIIITH